MIKIDQPSDEILCLDKDYTIVTGPGQSQDKRAVFLSRTRFWRCHRDASDRYVGNADRLVQIADLLQQRVWLISIYGRAGAGKTALACKAFADLRQADRDERSLTGIVCLSAIESILTLDRIIADRSRVLSDHDQIELEALSRNTDLQPAPKIKLVLEKLADRRLVVLLDNLETVQSLATGELLDASLQQLIEISLAQSGTLTFVLTSREPREHVIVMMTKAKVGGNYANSALAKTESVRLGFDEAIMLDPHGYVAECTGENIFVVRHGKTFTPPTTTFLEGVTRDSLIVIARDLGYEVIEQMISREQLYIADEVFVCGSAAECIALREIDFRIIGSGKMGPITRRIQHAFQDAIHGRDASYVHWLTPIKA